MRLHILSCLGLALLAACDSAPPAASDLAQPCGAGSCDDMTPKPPCAMTCSGDTPKCDEKTGLCVGCLMDGDCGQGQLCAFGKCKQGCSSGHPCAPDGGTCDVDLGVCRGCQGDQDCSGGTPRCDKDAEVCVPCLPGDTDNCPSGQFCSGSGGAEACVSGCKTKDECAGVDGGGGAVECCAHQCVALVTNSAHCGACGHACTGQSCCAATCVDLTIDPTNCGQCAQGCSFPNSMPKCYGGVCALGPCLAGWADCDKDPKNGCETNVAIDNNNCGACGKVCPPVAHGTPSCFGGMCGIGTCDTGWADCNKDPKDGCEINTASDTANCGSCGKTCPVPPHASGGCTGGVCGLGTCDAGWADCNKDVSDGCEAQIGSDLKNCGGCGKACPAIPHGAGACDMGQCTIASCSLGYLDCDKVVANGCEVQSANDLKNCGACGNACPTPANATPGCASGTCGIGACNTWYADCNQDPSDGCETYLLNNPTSCGACGKTCGAIPHGTAACKGFNCGIGSCDAGWADCDGIVANGCEVYLLDNVQSCGACFKQCPSVFAGTPGCKNGNCGIASCFANYADCDGIAQNGCEVYLPTHVKNCGSCGNVCPAIANGVPGCSGGVCGVGGCNTYYGDCNKDPKDGCEVYLYGNLNNCGFCGNVCPGITNGTPACNGTQCGIGSCNAGYAHCVGPNTACETWLLNNVNNCGACFKQCPSLYAATQACKNGTCGIGSCFANYADCDGIAANGCEVYLPTNVQNCGSCGHACPAIANGFAACTNGVCGVGGCNTYYGDCNKDPKDGCETYLFGNVSNCGSCGNACPGIVNGTPACTGTQCGIGSCNVNYAHCSGPNNACETYLLNNVQHCGSCANVCPFVANGSPTCNGSTCGIGSCNLNYADCDKQLGNGCEANILSDPKNCGKCGNACAAPATCVGGTCQARFGSTVTTGAYAVPANHLMGDAISVTLGGSLIRLGVISNSNGPKVILGLYADNSGAPGALVAQTAPTSMTTGTNELPVLQSTTLAGGTYWVVAVYDSAVSVGRQANNGALVDATYTFAAPLPMSFPAYAGITGGPLNYYAVVAQ